MNSQQNKFQCFLIVGSENETQNETAQIAKQHKINLKNPSPDIFTISPAKQSISIEEVRNLKKHIFQKPVHLPAKIIIFKKAHKLTIEAQNALLKILEEPPEGAILILESENKENILPTIRSRVIEVKAEKRLKTYDSFYLERSLQDLFENLPQIEDYQEWLDNQIAIAHKKIIENSKNSKQTPKPIIQALDACIATKKLVSANVNPTFAIANLYLQTVKD